MSEIEESAKAVGEVAKASNSAITLTTKVGQFVESVLGPTAKQMGLTTEDWAKYFRAKNLLAIQDKVNALRAARGLPALTNTIELSVGIPMIEGASMAEDENLRTKWAELIYSSVYTDTKTRKVFVELLNSLDSLDARVLDWLKKQGWNNALGKIDIVAIGDGLEEPEDEINISIRNLARLGLVDTGFLDLPESIIVSASQKGEHERIKLSPLGAKLLGVCTPTSDSD